MAATTNIVRTIRALRTYTNKWREQRQTIALVPTMGALHEGHLSLVEFAKKKADKVIVTIFVNPTQFGENEDLSKYPRNEKEDIKKLDNIGADLVFAPNINQIYPEGFSTTVSVTGLTDVLCGKSRPTHFSGVTTIVSKLLMQSLPDIAIFGEKDFQQLIIIKQMVQDLDIPVKIIGAPIVRESNGLAMSSRNIYLNEKHRKIAPNLYKELKQLTKQLPSEKSISNTLSQTIEKLTSLGFQVDYLELRDVKSLKNIQGKITTPARVFAAVYLGKTRLIDNMKVSKSK